MQHAAAGMMGEMQCKGADLTKAVHAPDTSMPMRGADLSGVKQEKEHEADHPMKSHSPMPVVMPRKMPHSGATMPHEMRRGKKR